MTDFGPFSVSLRRLPPSDDRAGAGGGIDLPSPVPVRMLGPDSPTPRRERRYRRSGPEIERRNILIVFGTIAVVSLALALMILLLP